MWAMGVLLYEMVTGVFPFKATNQAALIIKILSKDYDPLPETVNESTAKLVKNMLNKNQEKRPSLPKILKSSILASRAKDLSLLHLLPVEERNSSQNIRSSLDVSGNFVKRNMELQKKIKEGVSCIIKRLKSCK